jgi:hypothetical protein
MKRPPALEFVALSAIILGIAQIIASAGYLQVPGFEGLQAAWLLGDTGTVSPFTLSIAGIVLVIVGVMGVVFGAAALSMKQWAWGLGVATYLIGVFGAVFWLFATQAGVAAGATGIGGALIAWYLSTYDVRDAFGQRITMAGGHRPHAV